MATQAYDRGVEFNLSTWADLSSEWAWEGRTLSCFYIKSNDYPELSGGKMVELGSKMTLSGDYNNISGIWLINKSPYPVKIYLIGPDDGNVSVDVFECNKQFPIGSNSQPFYKTQQFSNVDIDSETKLVSCNVYWQTYEPGVVKDTYIRLKIEKDNSTTIKSVWWGNENLGTDIDSYIYSSASKEQCRALNGYTYQWHNKLTNFAENQKTYGLSVYFSTQGYLSYNKNNTYMNPEGTQT